MTDKVDVSLNNFYIFNAIFGLTEEEEDKKVLFFYPHKTDFSVQIKNVGLSQAIIKFARTFNSSEECCYLHTQKTKQIYYQPEENYWMVMTLNVPYTKWKDGIHEITYHGEDVHNELYLSQLKQSYQMAKLFIGSFSSLFNSLGSDIALLKQKLNNFFSRSINVIGYNVVDAFQGIQFLPLDKRTFLHVQCFVNLFSASFYDEVDFTIFLVNQHLVWSDLDTSGVQIIYRYLVTRLLAPFMYQKQNQQNTNDTSIASDADVSPSNDNYKFGRFITCPTYYQASGGNGGSFFNGGKVPKLLVRFNGDKSVYQLVVYNVLSSFFCMFIKEGRELSVELLRNIEAYLRVKMVAIASEILIYNEKRLTKSVVDHTAKFIYFNRLNLAQKDTLSINVENDLPSYIYNILADISFDIRNSKKMATMETVIKTHDDFWVIGQICNSREFYVVIQQKNSTLIDIQDELKKVQEKQLKSIFFHV